MRFVMMGGWEQVQKTDEPLCQIKKNTPAETDIQILFQSENKGFSVLGSSLFKYFMVFPSLILDTN